MKAIKVAILVGWLGMACTALSQQYGDVSFYLLDSLNLDEVSDEDQLLLDSNLTHYHATEDDIQKLEALGVIIEMCWDDNIWPRYNRYAKKLAKNTLKTEENPERIDRLNILLADIYGAEGVYYDSRGKSALAIKNYQIARDYLEKTPNKLSEAALYLNMGAAYNQLGDIELALEYYERCTDIMLEIGELEGLAACYNNIGYILDNQGSYIKALEYYHKSLKIQEQIGDKGGMAVSFNNIGSVYDLSDNNEKAAEYYRKGLQIRKEIKDLSGVANSLNNLANLKVELNDMDSARYFAFRSISVAKGQSDQEAIAKAYQTLGTIHGKENALDSATYYLNEALRINLENSRYFETLGQYRVLGNIYLRKGNLNKALSTTLEGIKYAEEYSSIVHMKDGYELASEIYKRLNRPYESLNYLEKFIEIKDSTDAIAVNNKAYQLEINAYYEKKSLQDSLENAQITALQEAEIEHANEQLKNERTIRYVLFSGLGIFLLLGVFLLRSFVQKKRDNRTISLQNELLSEKNNEINDSLLYAKRLQDAILPSHETIQDAFTENFILYLPKDVVSGDFYWFESKDDLHYIAAADCTGHGVPGAMVSVVCSNALHQSINEFGLTQPAEILDKAREIVIQRFAKSGEKVKDGMDISLCVINRKTNELKFCGANNPLWVIRKHENIPAGLKESKSTVIHEHLGLFEIKANKQPVGLYSGMKPFQQESIQLEKGDQIILFTDGFADQFGGSKGKKLKYRPFKSLLIEKANHPLTEQHLSLNDFFKRWKSDYEQIDDVCVVSVKL